MANKIASSTSEAIQWATNIGKFRGTGIMPVYAKLAGDKHQVIGLRKANLWEGIRVRFFDSSVEKQNLSIACSLGLTALRNDEKKSAGSELFRLADGSTQKVIVTGDTLFKNNNLPLLLKNGLLPLGIVDTQVEKNPENQSLTADGTVKSAFESLNNRWVHNKAPKVAFRLEVPTEGKPLASGGWAVRKEVGGAHGTFSHIPDRKEQYPVKFPQVHEHKTYTYDNEGALASVKVQRFLLKEVVAGKFSEKIGIYAPEGSDGETRSFKLKELATPPNNLIHQDEHGNITVWKTRLIKPDDNSAPKHCWHVKQFDNTGRAMTNQWARCETPLAFVNSKQTKTNKKVGFEPEAEVFTHIGSNPKDYVVEQVLTAQDASYATAYSERYEASLSHVQTELLQERTALHAQMVDQAIEEDVYEDMSGRLDQLNEQLHEVMEIQANRAQGKKSNDSLHVKVADQTQAIASDAPRRPSVAVEARMHAVQHPKAREPVSPIPTLEETNVKLAAEVTKINGLLASNPRLADAEFEILQEACDGHLVDAGDGHPEVTEMAQKEYHLSQLDFAIIKRYSDIMERGAQRVNDLITRAEELSDRADIFQFANTSGLIDERAKERRDILVQVDNHLVEMKRTQEILLATREAFAQRMNEFRLNPQDVLGRLVQPGSVELYVAEIGEEIQRYDRVLEALRGGPAEIKPPALVRSGSMVENPNYNRVDLTQGAYFAPVDEPDDIEEALSFENPQADDEEEYTTTHQIGGRNTLFAPTLESAEVIGGYRVLRPDEVEVHEGYGQLNHQDTASEFEDSVDLGPELASFENPNADDDEPLYDDIPAYLQNKGISPVIADLNQRYGVVLPLVQDRNPPSLLPAQGGTPPSGEWILEPDAVSLSSYNG